MKGDPSKSEPGSSKTPDGSNSGSVRSSPQEQMDVSPLQEHILNLSEDEWTVFSSMLHTPMTRTQFAELCMTILKVVSLSSISVILPAYVGVAKHADVLTSRSTTTATFSAYTSSESSKATSPKSESERASSSSPELPGGPVSELVRRMKGTLASLRRTVAWYPAEDTDGACSASERSDHTDVSKATHGDAAHDLTCITTILERLVASGRVHQIARNLVSQVQGALRDSGPASIPVAAGKSISDSVLSAKVKAAPKRAVSASHIVHTYAEEAIKNLLQPYFLPLVAWSASEEVTSSKMSSTSYASSRPGSATTKTTSPSLLGLEKDECSCLTAQLMQRLPADISYQDVHTSRPSTATRSRVTTSPSHGFSEVADLFTRVMTFQVMNIINSELQRHEQARLPSPETTTEGSMPLVIDTVPGQYGGFFSRLIQRFLSEFRYTESAMYDDVRDTSSFPRSLSVQSGTASCVSKSSPQKLQNVLELFTRVMVSQVMDIIHVASAMELVSPIAEGQTSRPSSAAFSDQLTIMGSDVITEGASLGDSASSENGCLVTVLMLRLLVKLRDQPTASTDMADSARKLIDKILSEFSTATGSLNFQAYPNNMKIQAIYKAMDKLLLKEFGPEAILQRAVETQDESFDTILLSSLKTELCNAEATSVLSLQSTSALSASPSAHSATHSARNATPLTQGSCPSEHSVSHSLVPVQGTADGQTEKVKPKRWLKIKMPKLGSKKVSPTNALSDFAGERVAAPEETTAHQTSSASTSGQSARKRSIFIRMFTCCFQGSSER